jgi:hypothetical protein
MWQVKTHCLAIVATACGCGAQGLSYDEGANCGRGILVGRESTRVARYPYVVKPTINSKNQ